MGARMPRLTLSPSPVLPELTSPWACWHPGGTLEWPELYACHPARILRAQSRSPGTIPTNRSGQLPDLDIAGVGAAYERRVLEACPEYLPLARSLLERLPPARWTLEWYLPWWLGHAFGLEAAVSREMVLSNVLGLGSIRLQDDLADGDVPSADIEGAGILSAALYDAALEPYREWFAPASSFWSELDRRMTEWRGRPPEDLAARGAPLHISAAAASLLGGNSSVDPSLVACLDRALEALVRYDHVSDWEADLDAGRWNVFVAAVASGPQTRAARERHRIAVSVALMTTNVADEQFSMIRHALLEATVLASNVEPSIPALTRYLRSFSAEVETWGSAFATHYRSLGDRAARLLLHETADA